MDAERTYSSDNRNCLRSDQSFLNLFKFKSVATYLLMPMAPESSARKVPAVGMHQKSEGKKEETMTFKKRKQVKKPSRTQNSAM